MYHMWKTGMSDKPAFINFDLHIGQKGVTSTPLSCSIRLQVKWRTRMDSHWSRGPSISSQLQHLKRCAITHEDLLALGRHLTGCLLPLGQVRDLYSISLRMVAVKHERLRLCLRITPPELAALPGSTPMTTIAPIFCDESAHCAGTLSRPTNAALLYRQPHTCTNLRTDLKFPSCFVCITTRCRQEGP